MADPEERAAYIRDRMAEQQADIDLLRLADSIVVDAVVQPERLRDELITRLAASDGWTRSHPRRHHPVSPV